MTKARTLADFISDGSPLADGAVDVSEVSGAAPLANPTFTGTASGTFSGPLTGDVSGDLDLPAISAAMNKDAKDIFVYDTSKDSDGGAWRKRTQHTSWYNETLNTATRGSRKEFPSVAVIVLEIDALTIYDGDDPDLPMWMVFSERSGGFINTTDSATGVVMLNGLLARSDDRGTSVGYGLATANFIEDKMKMISNQTASSTVASVGIEGRSTWNFYSTGTAHSQRLVNGYANDVAMTVLPNAPIDAATGLPVPTIAVATDGGVSVIKDDGTVVDSASTSVYYSVMFNGSDLYAEDTTFADDTQYYGDAGSLSDSFPTFRNFYSYSPAYELLSSSTLSKFSGNILSKMGEPRSFAVGLAADTASNASWTALNMVADHSGKNGYNNRTALVSYINSSFNTGWMNGDIKLATLSDTDDTDVTGSELVTNGTFDSNTSGWTVGSTSTATIVSGKLEITSTSVSDRNVRQSISVVAGKTYVFEFDSQTSPASGSARVRIGNTNGGYDYVDNIPGGSYTSYSYTFTPTQSTIWVTILPVTDGTTITRVDNISVRLAEEDRSVNGNGLQVFGTVTKNPVATGADLVAYSGFSSSNYLEQPYNSDITFGNGDLCIMGWVKKDGTASYRRFFSYEAAGGAQSDSSAINIKFGNEGDSTNGKLYVYLGSAEGVLPSASNNTDYIGDGNWAQFVFIRRSSVYELYINGTLIDTLASTQYKGSSTHKIRIGYGVSAAEPFTGGSAALFRVSKTAPSPEQIKKIYEDEKVLFQENAQATLYGSSDAVTALAYDDSTELLHVGTSAGRSDFQGLRRVNNTTNAVGAAISASNGMIVEE